MTETRSKPTPSVHEVVPPGMALRGRDGDGASDNEQVQSTPDSLQRLATLYQASLAISQATTEDQVTAALAKQLAYGEFDRGLVVLLRDKEEPSGEVCGHWDRSPQPAPPPRWLERCRFEGTARILDNIPTNPDIDEPSRASLMETGALSAATVPMLARDALVGALVLEARRPFKFTDDYLQPYEALASTAATAVLNLRLLDSERRRSDQLTSLVAISEAFGAISDLRQTCQVLTERMASALGVQRCLIALYDPAKRQVIGQSPAFGVPDPVAEAFRYEISGEMRDQWHLRQRGPYLTNNPKRDIVDQLKPFIDSFDIDSLLVVPMQAEGRVIGMIYAANRPGGFTERDAQLGTIFAGQVATVIRNAQLIERLETTAAKSTRQASQLSTLVQVFHRAQTTAELPAQVQILATGVVEAGLYRRAVLSVVDDAWQTIPGHSGYAGLSRPEIDFLQSSAPITRQERLLHFQEEFRVGSSYFVPAGRNPLRDRAVASHLAAGELKTWDPEDMLCIPLWLGNKLVGVLNVDDPFDGLRPTEETVLPLELFANLAAQMVENSRLFSNTEQLYQATSALTEAHSLTEISQTIAQQFRAIAGAEWAGVFLIDQERKHLAGLAESGRPFGTGPTVSYDALWEGLGGAVLRTGQPILSPGADDPRQPESDGLRRKELGMGSMMILPLTSEEQVVGEVILANRADQRQFTEQDLNRLLALARQASIALTNLRLLDEAQDRALQLETAAEISRTATSVLELDTLISETIELIRDRFRFYYVGLFLVDEVGKWAILSAGTGEAGQQQVAAGHRLAVGGDSMVGQAIAHREARIALDVGREAVHFANPYLPLTRSEMALPLVGRDRPIGALSIQSERPAAFSHQDIVILRTMADQLANAISNVRLLDQLQAALQEAQALQRRQTREAWDTLALARSAEGRGGFQYDLLEVQPVSQPTEPGSNGPDGSNTLVAPLTLHGQVIGSFGVEPESVDYRWSEDEIAIIDAVTSQLALALESAYHSEQAERRAAQLAAAARIGQALSSTVTAGELMRQAASLIQDSFGLYHVGILVLSESGQHAVLQEGTGHAGAIMKESNYSLPLAATHPVSQAIRRQEPVIARDVGQAEWSRNPLLPDTRAQMSIPLSTGGRPFGAIDIHSTQVAAFDEVDAVVFQTIAEQLAATLESARLFEETRQRASEQQMLFDVTTVAVTTPDLDTMLQRAAEIILASLGGTDLVILMADEESVYIQRAAAGFAAQRPKPLEIRLGDGVIGWVALAGEPVIYGDVSEAPHYVATVPGTRSELAVPILVDQRVAGVINLESDQPNAFDETDLRLLQTLSGTLGAIIKNISLVEELQEAYESLQEVDRLKTEFLANMSHELRTPLNSIIGFSRVILKGIDGAITDLQRQDLTSIYNSGQHLLGLINAILDLSKIEAGKMELAPEATSVTEIINVVMSAAVGLVKGKPIELIQNVPAELPPVWVDPFRLRQVLLNLISNAAKFTEQGSIALQAAYDPQAVFIQVIDTGIGISDKDMAKLFRSFSQVDSSSTRKAQGTGLGLAISAQLVEMQGGRIWVESELGKGSTFSVAIPRVNPAGDGPMIILSDQTAGKPTQERVVLAIDDEPKVIDLYRRYLGAHGYRVEGVTSGRQAVERAVSLAGDLTAITVDIIMPNTDGWEVISKLRSHPATQHVPIIICSVKAERERAAAAGVAHYLVKPFLQEDLLKAVEQCRQTNPVAVVGTP